MAFCSRTVLVLPLFLFGSPILTSADTVSDFNFLLMILRSSRFTLFSYPTLFFFLVPFSSYAGFFVVRPSKRQRTNSFTSPHQLMISKFQRCHSFVPGLC